MSKIAAYSLWGGLGTAGAVGVAVATGVLDLSQLRSAPQEPVALVQPAEKGLDETPAEVAVVSDKEIAAVPDKPEEPAAVATVASPVFDLVRVEPEGLTLVAGKGAPGAMVDFMVDGSMLAAAEVSPGGGFTGFLDLPPSANARVLSLRQTLGDVVVMSDEEVIIAPNPVAPEAVPEDTEAELEAVAEAVEDAPEQPADTVAEAAVDQDEADVIAEAEVQADDQGEAEPVVENDPVAEETAVAADATDAEPAEQEALAEADPEQTEEEAEVVAALEMAMVDPDAGDDLAAPAQVEAALADPAAPAAPADIPAEPGVSVAKQDAAPERQPAAPPKVADVAEPAAPSAPAVLLSSARGVEVLQSAPLAPGDVALDAISYDAEGEVLLSGRGDTSGYVRVYLDNKPLTDSRIEGDGRWRITLPQVDTGTYTLRVDQIDETGDVTARVESPFLRESPEVLEAAAAGEGPVRSVTVQPGATLWAIAQDRYGEGVEYVKVFKANKDRIRNPDLIYPGQIFDLPED